MSTEAVHPAESESRSATKRSRRRAAFVVAGACGVAAVCFGVMTAGVGMPRLPASIRVDVSETVTVTGPDGTVATLASAGPSTVRIPAEVVRLSLIDEASHVTGDVEVDPENTIRIPGKQLPESRVLRGTGVDAAGETVELHDPVALYALREGGGVLPESTDSFGDRAAEQGTTGVVVQVDDPVVSRIYPAYNLDTNTGDTVPAWDLQLDLAAAHAEGRTNLELPLSWYASPFAQGLDRAAPWLLGGSIVVGAAALVIARRNRTPDTLLRT